MDVIAFGQTNWDWCVTGKQHLTSGLARRGNRVLYVDPDWGAETAPLADAPRALAPAFSGYGVRRVLDRLHVFTHTPPPFLPWRLAVRRHARLVRGVARRLGLREPVVLTFTPRAHRFAPAVPAALRAHFAVDEMTGFGGRDPVARELVRLREEALVRASDVCFAISPRLLERLRRVQPHTHLLESAADVPHFARARDPSQPAHPALRALARPRIGFVGQLDERLDEPLVESLAARHPEWSVVLAGRPKRGVAFERLRGLANVHRVGFVPYPELPSLLRGLDVAIVPYRLTPLTRASSPLKVYEFLAAGLPVVTTPLDGLGDCRRAVAVADGAEAFVAAVRRALAAPDEGRALRLAVAEANRWERRVDVLEARLEEARRRAAPRLPALVDSPA